MKGITYRQLFLKPKQETELLIASPKFQEEIKKIRKIWGISQKGFKTDKEREKWQNKIDFYSISSLNAFKKVLIDLRIEFKLSDKWEDFLRHYLVYNKTRTLGGGFTIKMRINKDTEEQEMYIRIYKDTVLKDIMRRWKEIQILQKGLPGDNSKKRFKEIKKLQRNKRILELTEKGLKDKEIAEKVKKEFKEVLTYHDIPKIRNRFKKKLHHL